MSTEPLTKAEHDLAVSLNFDLDIVAMVKAETKRTFWAYNSPYDPLSPQSYIQRPGIPPTFVGLKKGLLQRIATIKQVLPKSPTAKKALTALIQKFQADYDKLPKEDSFEIPWRMSQIKPGMLFEIQQWFQYSRSLSEALAPKGYGFVRLEACSKHKDFSTISEAKNAQQSEEWKYASLHDFSNKSNVMNCVVKQENLINIDFDGDEEVLDNGDNSFTIHKQRPFRLMKMVEVILLYKRKSVSKTAANKFALIREEGTCGQEDGSSNAEIIAQLKKWDVEYGVDLINATVDSIDIKFKNLPADSTQLCQQLKKLCPDLDYPDSPVGLGKMAKDIRSAGGKLNLWWD
jgi:hypothetical protein